MFWEVLAAEDQASLRAVGAERAYDTGDYLFLEGDEPTHAIVLLAGQLKLTRSSPDGRSVLIEIRQQGELVGESGPIDRQPRSASAVALTPVEALVVPAAAFRRLLEERGTVALQLIVTLVERLRESAERRLESGTSDAVTRLAGRLVELSEDKPQTTAGEVVLGSALTQQDLAEWIGVSRDAVVLAFRQLRALGLIETGRRQIRILDLEGLRHFAHPG